MRGPSDPEARHASVAPPDRQRTTLLPRSRFPTASSPSTAIRHRRVVASLRCPAYGLSLALALFFWIAPPALAHEIRPTVVEIDRRDDVVDLAMRVNVEALIADIGIEHDDTDDSPQAATYDALRTLDADTLEARFATILPALLDALELRLTDAARLTPELTAVDIPDVGEVGAARDSTIRLRAPLPADAAADAALVWHWPTRYGPAIVRSVVAEGPASFSVYVLAGGTSDPLPLGEPVVSATGDATNDAASGNRGRSGFATFMNYVEVGFVHIIPLGLDHILFVIGLFLFAPRARPMIAQVTVFTLAHSVTLALATLGHVSVPSSIVEPLIALSIAAVCVENLFARQLGRVRLIVVFAFGLLHGLGFASVLQDVGATTSDFLISLLAFNVGVEVGQLAVVLACFATVGWWFRDASWYRRVVTVPGSLAIGAVGLWWFVERLLS